MPGLNVVALTSGGKDSIFSILHCQANHHKVVALANLHPPTNENDERADDLGSYMYQTIGHAVIPLYSEALGLPLYRQEITGSAINQDKSYGLEVADSDAAADETECLVPLLRAVMSAHPEVNAISTGAILSDYQRTRVESVAIRLGLIPLSYLWQWPNLPPQVPTSLLEDMAAVGQDARIVQVASGGIDDSFLWQNVSERRTITRLKKAAERFGTSGDGAVLGEGGEFETLTVDGPPPLWKGRIVVDTQDTEVVPGDAGSSSFKITKARVETKSQDDQSRAEPRIPHLLDPKFAGILSLLTSKYTQVNDDLMTPSEEVSTLKDPKPSDPSWSNGIGSKEVLFTIPQLSGEGVTAAEQAHSIMEMLRARLAECALSSENVVYTTIVLRNMEDFAPVNAIYGSYFKKPNPPARLTIACAEVLSEGAHLLMGFTASRRPVEGLHVQSRSYWAPANIGPYSQSIRVPTDSEASPTRALVYVAGQIPLVPASMELIKSPSDHDSTNFAHEVVLSLQHLVRIGRVMKVRRWSSAIAFIAGSRSDHTQLQAKVPAIKCAWESLHTSDLEELQETEEDEGFDVWDQQNRHGPSQWRFNTDTEAEVLTEDETGQPLPPLHIIRVDSLPRGSSIEWVSYGQTHGSPVSLASDHLDGVLRLFQKNVIINGP